MSFYIWELAPSGNQPVGKGVSVMTASNAFSFGNMLAGTSSARGEINNLFDNNMGENLRDANTELRKNKEGK
jgi:ADP-dependent phosphofructokinase/glucokinase